MSLDSNIQRMIRLVQSADAEKAKNVRLADRWATWIVVIALSAAIILAMTGILGPVVGALVHNAGSVIVILNSALLLKFRLLPGLQG